jgi:hypothetical protein
MHSAANGVCGARVIFLTITISDPWPALQQFFIAMTVPATDAKERLRRGPGRCSAVVFEHISIAAPSVTGEPQMLWGGDQTRIVDLVFHHRTVGDRVITQDGLFTTKEHVGRLIFRVE